MMFPCTPLSQWSIHGCWRFFKLLASNDLETTRSTNLSWEWLEEEASCAWEDRSAVSRAPSNPQHTGRNRTSEIIQLFEGHTWVNLKLSTIYIILKLLIRRWKKILIRATRTASLYHFSYSIGSLIGCIILFPQEVVLWLVLKIIFPAEVVLCSESEYQRIREMLSFWWTLFQGDLN